MKFNNLWGLGYCLGRSREGAWIEIPQANLSAFAVGVAPARERGLKYQRLLQSNNNFCRSREGAWIEIITKAAAT